MGAPQAREFSLFPPVGAPQAREFSLFPAVTASQAREFSLFPPVGASQAREFSLFPAVTASQAMEFSLFPPLEALQAAEFQIARQRRLDSPPNPVFFECVSMFLQWFPSKHGTLHFCLGGACGQLFFTAPKKCYATLFPHFKGSFSTFPRPSFHV